VDDVEKGTLGSDDDKGNAIIIIQIKYIYIK